MLTKKLKSKLKSLGSASKKNADDLIAEIHSLRAQYASHLDAALKQAGDLSDPDSRTKLQSELRQAAEKAKALKHYAYDLFPARRLKQFATKAAKMSAAETQQVADLIQQRLELQTAFVRDEVPAEKAVAASRMLRMIDTKLTSLLASPQEWAMVRVNNQVVLGLTNLAFWSVQPVGWAAEQVARPLMASNHWITGGKVSRLIGSAIHGFLSRDSLVRTGFETSWGVRLIVPGTVGFLGNAGPWVMFYTGQIRDYQAMQVPFRINPGATLATDIATLTMNRPGFGAGTATPIASGYVDSARSKLLVGRDGVLYVRVGIWEGRGAYFTVSAFIPLLPWMHITWNASVFSPGWEPLVRWSHPATIWVRGQADWLWNTITHSFAWMKRR